MRRGEKNPFQKICLYKNCSKKNLSCVYNYRMVNARIWNFMELPSRGNVMHWLGKFEVVGLKSVYMYLEVVR